MDSDDEQVGRVLTRRQTLRLLGTAGAALLFGCSSKTSDGDAFAEGVGGPCVVKPEQTEGPYFSDVQLKAQWIGVMLAGICRPQQDRGI